MKNAIHLSVHPFGHLRRYLYISSMGKWEGESERGVLQVQETLEAGREGVRKKIYRWINRWIDR